MSRHISPAKRKVWSWADVPSLNGREKPPRRRTVPIGRPRHPVTLGYLDSTIAALARRGDPVVLIASKIGCSDRVVARRLQALGRTARGH
jgi:hypothetical protein